jgi:PPP family 3-phenylpropionic acid transporter
LSSKNTLIISSYFLTYFIAGGAFTPLFGLYLQHLEFSGSQIGIITAISPLMMLLIQPFIGYLTDKTQRFHLLLITATLLATIVSLLLPFAGNSFLFIVTLIMLLACFQSGIEPILTSMVMSYTVGKKQTYADFRVWGAVGYALSVWALGQWTAEHSIVSIFYVQSTFLFLSVLFARKIPAGKPKIKTPITRKNVKILLKQRQFLLFLTACFFVYGAMLANNVYFGLLFLHLGGTMAGVGLSFLISVGTEVPMIRLAGKLIGRIKVTTMLTAASFLCALQYFCFSFHPSEMMIYALNVAQGVSMGIFIPVAVAYVQQNSTAELQTTAVGIFNGISFGLGNWFFTVIGGFVMDIGNITDVYVLFGIVSLFGTLLFYQLRRKEQKNTYHFVT